MFVDLFMTLILFTQDLLYFFCWLQKAKQKCQLMFKKLQNTNVMLIYGEGGGVTCEWGCNVTWELLHKSIASDI